MAMPPARTVPDPLVVVALQWIAQPRRPQQGCGVTGLPTTITLRPLTRTDATPIWAMPPAVFASPTLCIAGMLS